MGILPWYAKFVLLKGSMDSNSKSVDINNEKTKMTREGGTLVTLYDKIVVPFERVVEGIIPPPIGKNVIYVGEKI